jgi:hypothetical protein
MKAIVINNCGVGLHLRNEEIQWFKEHGYSDSEIDSFEDNRTHPALVEYVRTVNPCTNGFSLYSIIEYDENTHKPMIVSVARMGPDWYCEDVELLQIISRKNIFEFVLTNDMKGLTNYLETLDNVVVVD